MISRKKHMVWFKNAMKSIVHCMHAGKLEGNSRKQEKSIKVRKNLVVQILQLLLSKLLLNGEL